MKRLAILGSTGSIGRHTLDVVAAHPNEFQVTALAAGSNLDLLERQARSFRPGLLAVANEAGRAELCRRFAGAGIEVASGPAGLCRAATLPEVDVVVSAIVGAAGLRPTMAAARAGKVIALANKESLVMAGGLLTAEVRRQRGRILPVDSEHSAIFQCLNGGDRRQVRRLILTASGGPFRGLPSSAFAAITPEQALHHPTWSMGPKITIDSATLMNKGLEVIEAGWLFDVPVDRVDVIVHPQSTVHSMVEYVDGALLAQLGVPDMRVPIQYALTYPERRACPAAPLRLETLAGLTFESVDRERFPCLDLAYDAARAGGCMPAVLNAANEVAVGWFLGRRIGFDAIPGVIRKALDGWPRQEVASVEEVLEVDGAVRRRLEDH